jgi:hypothetical protein
LAASEALVELVELEELEESVELEALEASVVLADPVASEVSVVSADLVASEVSVVSADLVAQVASVAPLNPKPAAPLVGAPTGNTVLSTAAARLTPIARPPTSLAAARVETRSQAVRHPLGIEFRSSHVAHPAQAIAPELVLPTVRARETVARSEAGRTA